MKNIKKRNKKVVRANINHYLHQVHVTGVGPHQNKKKYTRKNKHKNKSYE